MNAFQAYLDRKLAEKLKKRRVVVWYDPNQEFAPYIAGLPVVADDLGCLPVVQIEGIDTTLVRYQGSYFGVRMAVEPLVSADIPAQVLIYVAGDKRDKSTSLLIELEKGGECLEPQGFNLKRLALNVLRETYSDGVIDGLLASESLVYNDIVKFLENPNGDEPASMLKVVFEGCRDSMALLVSWVADNRTDAAVEAKNAKPELFKLVETRLGFTIPPSSDVASARSRTIRYLLVNEFRADLQCEPPTSLAGIPESLDKAQNRVRQVIKSLRKDHADSYAQLSDQVETELGLAKEKIEAQHLGSIDTFRFEEKALLTYCGELVAEGRYDEALKIANERSSSFWVDRDVARQAQWGACRLMAQLGLDVERIRPIVAGNGKSAAAWVAAYTGDNGCYSADLAHRTLESWVAKMDDEPETEKALAVVRMRYEELLRLLADGFTKAFKEAGWTVPKVLHQSHIYPDVVTPSGGRVAYFFVDAMRYEMGVELVRLLEDGEELAIQPAIAALPTITPVGMAALLPGAASSFSVVEKGKLAVRIEDSIMAVFQERMKLLKAKVPDVAEMTLGKLLQESKGKVAKKIGEASLVVVRSQEIDTLGEGGDDLLARQVMDTTLGNIARGVRKLAALGIERFVITADHGYQFSIPKAADMQTDNPGGKTLEIHRRCWVGHGGSTPPGAVRITGAELGYDTDLDFIFPTGLGVFATYGGLSYHHGGISLQELVIPVISLRLRAGTEEAETGFKVAIEGYPQTITNRTFPVRVSVTADLFAQEKIPLRFVLISQGEQVGQAGMAIGAECDAMTGIVHVATSAEAHIGMIVKRDDCESLRIVVQHPETDAILARSEELPLRLGI